MKTTRATFKELFAASRRREKERIRKAGKHKCVRTCSGSARRLTSGDKILKRPVRGKVKSFGPFKTTKEAARFYDNLVLKERGEFASTNKSLGLL